MRRGYGEEMRRGRNGGEGKADGQVTHGHCGARHKGGRLRWWVYLSQFGRPRVTQHQQQVRVQRAHTTRVQVHLVVVKGREPIVRVGLALCELLVPAQKHAPQIDPQNFMQRDPRLCQLLRHPSGQLELAERLATDGVVRACGQNANA